MSLYRTLRLTLVLSLARRYRTRLLRILFAVAFAVVSSLVYADVAAFLDARHPQWSGLALIVKTAIVYGALLISFWDLSRMLRGDPGVAGGVPAQTGQPAPGTLDALIEKPQLRSRRDEILEGGKRGAD